jgi:hypothetical protein
MFHKLAKSKRQPKVTKKLPLLILSDIRAPFLFFLISYSAIVLDGFTPLPPFRKQKFGLKPSVYNEIRTRRRLNTLNRIQVSSIINKITTRTGDNNPRNYPRSTVLLLSVSDDGIPQQQNVNTLSFPNKQPRIFQNRLNKIRNRHQTCAPVVHRLSNNRGRFLSATTLWCQLLGMNCASESEFVLGWDDFCERGGGSDVHKDGWGLAYYIGNGIRQFHDIEAASTSPLAKFIGSQQIQSRNLLAHIRYATTGSVNLANVHPFCRE